MTQVLDRERLEDIPTARDDDFCHIAMDPLPTGGPYEAVCGVLVDEPACCSPGFGAAECGRPVCPECQGALRKKAR